MGTVESKKELNKIHCVNEREKRNEEYQTKRRESCEIITGHRKVFGNCWRNWQRRSEFKQATTIDVKKGHQKNQICASFGSKIYIGALRVKNRKDTALILWNLVWRWMRNTWINKGSFYRRWSSAAAFRWIERAE